MNQDEGLFVNCYSGLGDALIQGPALAGLSALLDGRLYFPHSPVLDLYRSLQVKNLSGIIGIDPKIRRLVDFERDAPVAALKKLGVQTVFNLRWDRSRFGSRYEDVVRTLRGAGITIVDLCEVLPRERRHQHVARLTAEFLSLIGLPVPDFRFGWLRDNIQGGGWVPDVKASVGFYLGASQPIKRFSPHFWFSVMERCHSQFEAPLLLFPGQSPDEVSLGQNVAALLETARIPYGIVWGQTLDSLSRTVAGLPMMVSADSFMVHFAESLGTRVVGVYNATDPIMYGPQHGDDWFLSPYYSICPLRNEFGNCAGWDLGCPTPPCHRDLDPAEVAALILKRLSLTTV